MNRLTVVFAQPFGDYSLNCRLRGERLVIFSDPKYTRSHRRHVLLDIEHKF